MVVVAPPPRPLQRMMLDPTRTTFPCFFSSGVVSFAAGVGSHNSDWPMPIANSDDRCHRRHRHRDWASSLSIVPVAGPMVVVAAVAVAVVVEVEVMTMVVN